MYKRQADDSEAEGEEEKKARLVALHLSACQEIGRKIISQDADFFEALKAADKAAGSGTDGFWDYVDARKRALQHGVAKDVEIQVVSCCEADIENINNVDVLADACMCGGPGEGLIRKITPLRVC